MGTSESVKEKYALKLEKYLPAGTGALIAHWIVELNVKFVVAPPRKSKFGDFRPAVKGGVHCISVNGDLNPYAFLITSLHEFAHLGCWLKHSNTVLPHGGEWKAIFSNMLKPFVSKNIFPPDVMQALQKYIRNPKASSCSSPQLMRALKNYDVNDGTILLENLAPGAEFYFRGQKFCRHEKRRSRILCKNLDTEKMFLISGIADVKPCHLSPEHTTLKF